MDFFAKRNFSFEQIPDLTGKTAIITGSNTGVSAKCSSTFQHCAHLLFLDW